MDNAEASEDTKRGVLIVLAILAVLALMARCQNEHYASVDGQIQLFKEETSGKYEPRACSQCGQPTGNSTGTCMRCWQKK